MISIKKGRFLICNKNKKKNDFVKIHFIKKCV